MEGEKEDKLYSGQDPGKLSFTLVSFPSLASASLPFLKRGERGAPAPAVKKEIPSFRGERSEEVEARLGTLTTRARHSNLELG